MSHESAREVWRKKLDFLIAKEARAYDPEQKFSLQEAIAEAKAKLRQLSERAGDSDDAILRVATTRLRHGAEKLVGREKELCNLDKAWDDPKTHVVTIVAWGGVGKTALVVDWMARMAADGWRGAERVFDWSFYSQGTSEMTSASSDAFVAKALEFFGDPEMAQSAASPWDKSERLARLVAEHKTLLVLDGIEPLQYPPGPVGGKLKDPALEALLKGLAQHNTGLCLVTSREALTDLVPWQNTTSPRWDLEHLSDEAGAQLLFNSGVTRVGNDCVKADDQELKDAAREVAGHALTLQLLGRYLAKVHNGNVRKRSLVAFEKADSKVQGGHAFKIMKAYKIWLGKAGEEGKRQLAVLHLLGLFDRPADAGCLAALRREPAIRGLTEPLIGLDDDEWNYTLSNLAECAIISVHTDQSTLDAHPLVREYFAHQLQERNPKAWKSAHLRLCQYLCEAAPDLPDDYPTMVPLFQAFIHGCLAGEHRKCLDEIYRRRIERGRQHYLTNVLGAISTEIHLLGFLFKKRWTKTVDAIQEERQAYAFRQIGLAFRALGDIDVAALQLVTAVEHSRKIDDRNSEINSCRHLAQALATAGRLQEALNWAKQAVDRIDARVIQFDAVAAFAGLGHILHQLGKASEATPYFERAEQQLNAPGCKDKCLSSLQGFRYCELLVEQRKYHEVLKRLGGALHRENHANFRAARGLNRVMRAKTLYLAWINGIDLGVQLDEISHELDTGLITLWYAWQREFYVFGLLCRADFRAHQRNASGVRTGLNKAENTDGCRADLDEAWQIAERGGMRLYMVDILLRRARLFRDKAALAEAAKLINECGYHRRDEELTDAQKAAKSW